VAAVLDNAGNGEPSRPGRCRSLRSVSSNCGSGQRGKLRLQMIDIAAPIEIKYAPKADKANT